MPRKREKKVTLRLTEKEYEKFIKLVEVSEMSQQEYLRRAALKKKITVINGIPELATQIRKIGININQITRVANESKTVTDTQIKNVIEHLSSVWILLNDFLKIKK